MTAAADDDWAAAAMGEDALVVDMLLRLKRSTKHGRPWAGRLAADLAPAGWGATQPRSASASAVVHSGVKRSEERIGRSRRCSPSTPLSWSGGSGSGGVDGCETSSLPVANRSPSSRSKINLAGSEVNGASSSKARKKKTYAELSEEEVILLKERMHLNQELAMLGATVMEQRAENENLKRIKLDLSTQLIKNNQYPAAAAGGAGDGPSRQAVVEAVAQDCTPSASIPSRPIPASTSCKPESDIILPAQKRGNSMLPDLNMMPSELDSMADQNDHA